MLLSRAISKSCYAFLGIEAKPIYFKAALAKSHTLQTPQVLTFSNPVLKSAVVTFAKPTFQFHKIQMLSSTCKLGGL